MRKQHEYMRRLDIALANGLIDQGTAAMSHVFHDDDCQIFDGGMCACDPEIKIITLDGECYIDADGLISETH